MDIRFYHLSKSPIEKALAKLLEKIIAAGKKAVVIVDTAEQLSLLNTALWTYSPSSFLPHGVDEDGFNEHQPIFLTTQTENPNHADILVTIDGASVDSRENFDQCLDLFNGLDSENLEKARMRWKKLKDQGHNLAYWFQNEAGGWILKQQ